MEDKLKFRHDAAAEHFYLDLQKFADSDGTGTTVKISAKTSR